MNVGKIYQDAARGGVRQQTSDNIEKILHPLHPQLLEPPEHPSSKDAGRATLMHGWLQSTVTQEFIKHLHDEIHKLTLNAIQLSCTFAQHQNHFQIINLLVRVNELQQLVNKYSKI